MVLADKGHTGSSGATASAGTGVWYVDDVPELREAAMATRRDQSRSLRRSVAPPHLDNSTAGVRRRLIERAKTAEAGGFDALFFADGLNYGPSATWAYKTTEDLELARTTAALSSVTERIGLVATGSTTLAHPHHPARQLLSPDTSAPGAPAAIW